MTKASNTINSTASQRYVPKAYTTPNQRDSLQSVGLASMGSKSASLPGEADISTYKTTVVED